MYKVVRVAENNVELYESKSVATADNGEVEAYADPPKVYGEQRVQKELEDIARERERINAFDKKAELAKLDAKEIMLREIETALCTES